MQRRYIVGTAILAVLVAALLYLYGGGQTPSGQPPLRSVTNQNIADIKNEFNAAKSEVRVVLMLSPT
jgi:hypothetical protein